MWIDWRKNERWTFLPDRIYKKLCQAEKLFHAQNTEPNPRLKEKIKQERIPHKVSLIRKLHLVLDKSLYTNIHQ